MKKFLRSRKNLAMLACILLVIALALYVVINTQSPLSASLRTGYLRVTQGIRRQQAIGASADEGADIPVTPVQLRVSDVDGMAQVYVPEGKFSMGTDDKEAQKNRPAHGVVLSAFWIDQTEVSNRMFALCVEAGECKPPLVGGNNTYYGKSGYDDYPVVYVSWESADTYCRWAGRRLPTEAEWEKAARGTDGRLYPWGDNLPDMTLANFDNNIGEPVPVDRYPLGASPYGALNMAGNVREWVADWFHEFYYIVAPRANPLGPPSGGAKSLRGGSYLDDGNEIRVFNRFFHPPGSPGINRGFRCASDAEN